MRRLGIADLAATIIPNGAPDDLRPVQRSSSDGRIGVGVLGRLDPQKGMDVFLGAVEALPRLSGVEFEIGAGAGFPDFERDTRATAAGLGVQIHESAGNGVAFLSSLDVVVIPSRWEGSPLTLFEALALGKPIIASQIPGIQEVVGPEDAALLVPRDDPRALALAIQRLIDDVALQRALSERALRVSSRFRLSAAASRASEVVLSAAAAAPRLHGNHD